MTKTNDKVQDKSFQKFLKQIFEFPLKHFAENQKENFSQNHSLFSSNLKNAKTNTILKTWIQ